MNPCPLFDDLERYHDGQLDSLQVAKFERHLASCQDCQAHLASLKQLRALLGQGHLPELRPLSLAQLHQGLDKYVAGQSARQAQQSVVRLAEWLTGAAAIVLLVSSVQLFFFQGTPTASASPSLAWEMTNAMLAQENTAGETIPSEHSLAAWIVSDLSAQNAADKTTGSNPE